MDGVAAIHFQTGGLLRKSGNHIHHRSHLPFSELEKPFIAGQAFLVQLVAVRVPGSGSLVDHWPGAVELRQPLFRRQRRHVGRAEPAFAGG